ncbi:MAG TPA: thiamine-phosphate kinase [Candidatus Binataceae bacterium]|nr:thiamine-phosphate kinase [Candidatus Binataceae bacterium]
MKEPPGEFELIARLCANLAQRRHVILGPGDDCAIVAASSKSQLITIDSMVEGVHFKLDWGTPAMLGARALTVNLSDIAAMGGNPTICVVNLAIRAGLDTRFFDSLYSGLQRAAASNGVSVAGGNVTRASQLSITIALLGEVGTAPLRRDSAWRGDKIYVTGTIGDAALGLRILQNKIAAKGPARDYLVKRFLQPTAQVAAGRKLARIKPSPTAIDISDGLWQDLGHILERSGVGAEVDSSALPLSPAYRQIYGSNYDLAMSGGDDYELLFCLRAPISEAELSRRLGVKIRCIGKITREKRAVLISSNGETVTVPSRGWDQLRAT